MIFQEVPYLDPPMYSLLGSAEQKTALASGMPVVAISFNS